MRVFFAAALLVAVLGFLGFRILDLEQRVAALSRQLDGEQPSTPETPDHAADSGVASLGYERRLAALEKRMSHMKANVSGLEHSAGLGLGLPGPQADKQILSVMERENSRVRDVQLEWSRSRWLESRQQQLTHFAKQFNLDPTQTTEMQQSMTREVDSMVDVLRRPNLLDDPDSAAQDWQALLDETDRTAQRVLSPAQLVAWTQYRMLERHLLWPWLPNDMNKQAQQ